MVKFEPSLIDFYTLKLSLLSKIILGFNRIFSHILQARIQDQSKTIFLGHLKTESGAQLQQLSVGLNNHSIPRQYPQSQREFIILYVPYYFNLNWYMLDWRGWSHFSRKSTGKVLNISNRLYMIQTISYSAYNIFH